MEQFLKRTELETFTFVVVDPQCYGKNRPPGCRVDVRNAFVLQKNERLLGQTRYVCTP